MSLAAFVNSLAPVVVTISGGATVTLALESMEFSADILEQVHHHSGNMSPTLIRSPGANPRARVAMPFALALSTFGQGVAKLTALDLYFTRFVDFVRAANTNAVHSKLGLQSGAVAAAEIVDWHVNVDGILMADVEFHGVGSAVDVHPFALTPTVTLPTLNGSPQLHTLGPVGIEGTLIPGAAGHSGSVQGNLEIQRNDGDRYPRVARRTMIAPVVHIAHEDPLSVIAAIGLQGQAITVAAVAYFKAYDATTGLVGLTNGISITIAAGRVSHSGADSSQGMVSHNMLTITGISADGVANPLVIATGVTVPTPP